MDWLVQNARNTDVERQHLNKILADIRASIVKIEGEVKLVINKDVHDVVGSMLSGEQTGIKVWYDATKSTINFRVPNFTIRLTGDVTGSGTVNALTDVNIVTTLDADVGISDAPNTGDAFWRRSQEWEQVPVLVDSLATLPDDGLLVADGDELRTAIPTDIPSPFVVYLTDEDGNFLTDDDGNYLISDDIEPDLFALALTDPGILTHTGPDTWETREIEGTTGNIDVANGDGVAGNPVIDLSDVGDSGLGDLVGVDIDAKGRVVGVRDVDTDDLEEGVTNLYHTDARAQAAVVVDSIADSDTTHAPSRNAVFDALAAKQNSSTLLTAIASHTGSITGNQLFVAQTSSAVDALAILANNIPGRSSTGDLVNKPVTDTAFNALSNMASGSFTPTVLGSTTAGVATYTTQNGTYIRMGNVVHFRLHVAITAHTGTGNLRIDGLPFTSETVGNSPVTVGTFSNLALPANSSVVADVLANSTQVRILFYSTAGGSVGAAGLSLDTAFEVQIAGTYFTA